MGAAKSNLEHVAAPLEERSLATRGLTSWGGYGLLVSPCIEGTSTCGDSCCPIGYLCSSIGDHKNSWGTTPAVCCPTGVDCTATVMVVPACANTTWGLYHAYGEFCCAADSVGIYPTGGAWCMSNTLPIPADKLASSVKQITSTKAATATGGGSTATAGGSTTSSASVAVATFGISTSPPPATTSGSSKSGLSQNATIAIAVLAAAFGLLLLSVILYFWRKKRRFNKAVPTSSDPLRSESISDIISSLNAANRPDQPVAVKTPEIRVNELLGKKVLTSAETAELDTAHRAELYGNSRI